MSNTRTAVGGGSRVASHVRCLDDAKGGFPASGRFCSLQRVCRSAGLQGGPIAFFWSGFFHRRRRQQRDSITTRLNHVSTVSCRIALVGDRTLARTDERTAHARPLAGELTPGRIRLVYLADGGVRRVGAGPARRAVAHPRQPARACAGRAFAEPLQPGAGHALVHSRLWFPLQFWRSRRAGAGRRGAADHAGRADRDGWAGYRVGRAHRGDSRSVVHHLRECRRWRPGDPDARTGRHAVHAGRGDRRRTGLSPHARGNQWQRRLAGRLAGGQCHTARRLPHARDGGNQPPHRQAALAGRGRHARAHPPCNRQPRRRSRWPDPGSGPGGPFPGAAAEPAIRFRRDGRAAAPLAGLGWTGRRRRYVPAAQLLRPARVQQPPPVAEQRPDRL